MKDTYCGSAMKIIVASIAGRRKMQLGGANEAEILGTEKPSGILRAWTEIVLSFTRK
jgi:hypothetical protein